jgi:hypothetical protein
MKTTVSLPYRQSLRTRLKNVIEGIHDSFRFKRIKKTYGPLRHSASPTSAQPTNRRLLRRKIRILFYPHRPEPSSVVHKLCALLGYSLTNNPRGSYDVVFRYDNSTYLQSDLFESPENRIPIINRRLSDISKVQVDRIFRGVFGYSLTVDPTSHRGPIVEKSNSNATHDGQIVNCPLNPESVNPDCIYQKIVNNTWGKDMIRDFRIPVHGGRIPHAYIKYRPMKIRFKNDNRSVDIVDTESAFEKKELKGIVEFADSMGIDYAELDILRDNGDGRIYIIDANSTPWGPPNGLTFDQRRAALFRLAETFQNLIAEYRL